MHNFMRTHKLEQLSEGGAGGAPDPKSKAEPIAAAAAKPAEVKEEGDTHDDLGYEKTPAVEAEKKQEAAGDKKPDAVKPVEKVEVVATGYTAAPKAAEEVKVVVPPKEPTKLDYEIKVDGVPADIVESIKDFAKKNAMTKEQAQAFSDLKKSEHEGLLAQAAAYKKEEADLRVSWFNELKTDQVFGGENFDRNVMQAEKVMDQFMPNTKKMLTERGSMLPPYVMRDLAKLAQHLYAKDPLVQGEAIKPSVNETEVDDALSYYR